MYTIPKIIHQIWIGNKPAPKKIMETWKNKHPDFEYIFWNEQEIINRNLDLQCQDKINMINEINGKADIIRWEILYQYGGIFIDADSICLEPFDDYFMCKKAFASYENEQVRKGLVATGTLGFYPKHPLCRDIIDWIKSDDSTTFIQNYRAWYSVGPGVLTRFLNSGNYPDFSVFPSHVFLPVHFEGDPYVGHKKIYAHQYWGTNYELYDSDYFSQDSLFELPESLKTPEKWVSLFLYTDENSDVSKIKECLDSIKYQRGRFCIEVLWMDFRSIESRENKQLLESFERNTRFTKITYHRFLQQNQTTNQDYIKIGMMLMNGDFMFSLDINKQIPPNAIQRQIDFFSKKGKKMERKIVEL